jgi:hypothetical protein
MLQQQQGEGELMSDNDEGYSFAKVDRIGFQYSVQFLWLK